MYWKCRLGFHNRYETGTDFNDPVKCKNCDTVWRHAYDFKTAFLVKKRR